jgi:hypothetical protein
MLDPHPFEAAERFVTESKPREEREDPPTWRIAKGSPNEPGV